MRWTLPQDYRYTNKLDNFCKATQLVRVQVRSKHRSYWTEWVSLSFYRKAWNLLEVWGEVRTHTHTHTWLGVCACTHTCTHMCYSEFHTAISSPLPQSDMLCLVAQSCAILCDAMDCSPPGSSVHGDSPGETIGVGCHALLQGIFLAQGSNPGLPHRRWILYHLSHQGSSK